MDWSPLVPQAHLSLQLGCRAISGDPNCLQLLAWHFGFPGGSDGKASARKAGDPCSIPGSGRSSGEGYGNPLQYSCLENSMDGGAWWATVHRVANSRMQLSDFTFTFFVSNPATRRGCVMHLDSYTDSHRLVIWALPTPPHHPLGQDWSTDQEKQARLPVSHSPRATEMAWGVPDGSLTQVASAPSHGTHSKCDGLYLWEDSGFQSSDISLAGPGGD